MHIAQKHLALGRNFQGSDPTPSGKGCLNITTFKLKSKDVWTLPSYKFWVTNWADKILSVMCSLYTLKLEILVLYHCLCYFELRYFVPQLTTI